MSKVNKELLDKYDKLVVELFEMVQVLQTVHKKMTPQERQLAGAILIKIESSWGERAMSAFVGDGEGVAILINKAGYELQASMNKPKSPVFTDKDKFPN